jgi:hypothetical protein
LVAHAVSKEWTFDEDDPDSSLDDSTIWGDADLESVSDDTTASVRTVHEAFSTAAKLG